MPIYNIGSINIDHFYQVDRFALPGETMLTDRYSAGLGGKGANQSIAVARAGAKVAHIGAIGSDGTWCLERLRQEGVDCDSCFQVEAATGHAVIQIDSKGENLILVHSGANKCLDQARIEAGLATASAEDLLVLQNETNLTQEIVSIGRTKGMKVAYSAAPFDPDVTASLLPETELLCVNEQEAESLAAQIGCAVDALPVPRLLVTKGSKGSVYRMGEESFTHPGYAVTAVDTTGAGDCFFGFFLAAMDEGLGPQDCLDLASATAAIQVTRPGTAEAIPTRAEAEAFLRDNKGI